MIPPTRHGFFLSLKWKALLLSSIALVVVTGALVTINYIELLNQFEQRRAESQNLYARQVQGLLEQSSKQLRQWSTIIASLLRTNTDSVDPDQKQMIAIFEHLAAILELDLGMESVALISSSNRLLAMHGLEPGSSTWTTLAQVSRQVATTESPVSLLECSETCLQYAIAPILGIGGTLVLGLSLADIVLDFQQVSGTDLGLVVGQTRTVSKNGDGERWLQQWGVKVAALSNMRTNIEILRAATRENTLSGSAKQSVYVNMNNREFEVRLFPLLGFGEWTDAYLVIIADVSDAMTRIRAALQRNITLGTIGLVLSELLLLAILWAPMSRLRRAAANLPWLADGAFVKVRKAITATRQTQFFRDEVSVLNDTAIALSHQLEALNDEAVERTRDLSKQMAEITQQRNFVNHILETAQTIILTQDRFNKVLRINPYGLAITGYSLEELQERPFITLLAHKEGADSVQEKLTELVSGIQEHVEMECDLYCRDRSVRNVIWYHSRLKSQIDDDPIILSVGMDITARKNAELQLAWLADHDPLTGLYNRRRFELELKEAIAAAKRYRHSGALLFLDVDQFKYINDTSGHGAGDRLLQRLGGLFPSILREVDVICRLGGDEFAVILTQATGEEAVQVTRKILASISEIEFQVEDQTHKLSASIGIALFPWHGTNIEELLAKADLAMYRVKDSGRGGWHLLSGDDQSQRLMRTRVRWKQRVEHALVNDRFLLYAQPILAVRDRTVSHYEILLRMQGDDGEIMLPGQFIEVAEKSGLIHSIDRMVMSKAIHYQFLAERQGLQVIFTINLSTHAFNNPDLLSYLKQVLQETGLAPQRIIFEMTETAAIADLVAARRFMEAINEIGCRFALDDFGTGFSSFQYLKELPFDLIKIDGSFIRKLSSRTDDQILVKAMAEIAHAFGKKTVAEYVEDQETLALLDKYRIDYAQGYHVGRPVPVTSILEENLLH